jgi:pSer/pThr/pTyr-binding forkhead associated (FHA) protein
MDKLPTLIVTMPKGETETFELQGDRIGLGREADNQIHVAAKSVSSCHCEFKKKGDGYEIIDLDSTNGTRINGKVIEDAHTLEDGDRILLGETVAAHFVMLGAGQVAKEAAIAGDESQNAAAAVYTKFDDKLHEIEVDIAAKQEQHDKIEAQLELMHEDFDTKKEEHDKLIASLERLQTKLDEKKAKGGSQEEIARLEDELITKTRRVKVLAHDLETKAHQMQSLSPDSKPKIKVAEMTPPGAAPRKPKAPSPPGAAPAPKPIPIPAAPAAGAPPVGRGTMKIAGAGEGEEAPKKKLLVDQPVKPRPKFKLD